MNRPYLEILTSAFQDELQKIAMDLKPALGVAAAGAVGWEMLRRAERDRRMGKAMRVQQGSY